MVSAASNPMIQRLSERRRTLGLSLAALAERSGVSEPTVKRILGGRAAEASLANVAAVAGALGMSLELAESDPGAMLREQALRKAKQLAQMVQGTSALESQAVDAGAYERLVERTYHELLAGPRRRLWAP